MMKKNKHDPEVIKDLIKNSFSVASVIKGLGLTAANGANYKFIKWFIKENNVDISHFTGKGHLKNKTHSHNKKIPLEDILVENSNYQSNKLRKRLIKEGVFTAACFKCGINNWQDLPLTLHLDHINGDQFDNRLENLQLLCPNCHSQTPTYCGKNINKGVRK